MSLKKDFGAVPVPLFEWLVSQEATPRNGDEQSFLRIGLVRRSRATRRGGHGWHQFFTGRRSADPIN